MEPERFETIIIGTGFAGLGLAAKLRESGKMIFCCLRRLTPLAGRGG